jgi:RNA-binding protein 39
LICRETEPNWDVEIRDDVSEECSKFGKVVHAFVDSNSAGHMYLKFENVNAATNALNSLNGRWFAQRMIYAEFINEKDYER